MSETAEWVGPDGTLYSADYVPLTGRTVLMMADLADIDVQADQGAAVRQIMQLWPRLVSTCYAGLDEVDPLDMPVDAILSLYADHPHFRNEGSDGPEDA